MHTINYNLFPHGAHHCITLSYDDGKIPDIRLAALLRENGLKATFHINSGRLGVGDMFGADRLSEIYHGHEISCHMATHPFPTDIPDISVLEEILEDRRILEAACGYVVRGMSYPFGNYNAQVKELCRTAGMEYSRTTISTRSYAMPNDFLEWHPTCHHNDNIMDKLEHLYDYDRFGRMRLLYIWGHSNEFDMANNWHVIEDFCKAASHRDDTWYATNIEIVDYINAVRSLRIGADRSMIFNPSSLTAWVTVDGEALSIRPGETVRL